MNKGETLPQANLHAPQKSGQALVSPTGLELITSARENRRHLEHAILTFQGTSLALLRRESQRELRCLATNYTLSYRDSQWARSATLGSAFSESDKHIGSERKAADESAVSLFLGGHQPTLFHPGVWFKNFFLSELARRGNGIPINLVIDNDLASSKSIFVPAGDEHYRYFKSVPYDDPGLPYAFEECPIVNPKTLASFPVRVRSELKGIAGTPLVEAIWRFLDRSISSDGNLGLTLARMRHAYEEHVGLDSLELPLSQVCGLTAFKKFALEIFANASAFRESYNSVLYHYRQLNRIRSSAHPVPPLEEEQGWTEVPFWIWSQSTPRRRRLYVKWRGSDLLLSDLHGLEKTLAEATALSEWAELQRAGIAIRPRALTTTMFCRLVLSDVFVHGIGGSKYDELTDNLIWQYWGIQPPVYATATATYRLPVAGRPWTTTEMVRSTQSRLREMSYHPEKFLGARDGAVEEYIQRKRELLNLQPTFASQATFANEMQHVNQSLRAALSEEIQATEEELERLRHSFQQDRVLGSREFSFVCFPETLPIQLRDLAQAQFKN